MAKLMENRHVRLTWLTNNIGYMRCKTAKASRTFLIALADQFDMSRSTLRIWHTKHLIIMWETDGGDRTALSQELIP